MRDAVKSAAQEAPEAGKFKGPASADEACEAAGQGRSRASREGCLTWKSRSQPRRQVGGLCATLREISGSSRAPIHSTLRPLQLAKRRAGTHKSQEPRRNLAHRQRGLTRRKGTGQARHGSRRVNLFPAAAVHSVRWASQMSYGLQKKVRALALKHALSAKAKDGGIIVLDKRVVKDGKTKALPRSSSKLGLPTR
jgi:hypothetical protein